MKITIEKTQSVKEEIELPEYFTTLTGWFYKCLPDNKVLHVTELGATVSYTTSALKYVQDNIKPCTQDEFVIAYCKAVNQISAASGIEHLPLRLEEVDNAG